MVNKSSLAWLLPKSYMDLCYQTTVLARILVQVTRYRRLRIGRDDQSEAYDMS